MGEGTLLDLFLKFLNAFRNTVSDSYRQDPFLMFFYCI